MGYQSLSPGETNGNGIHSHSRSSATSTGPQRHSVRQTPSRALLGGIGYGWHFVKLRLASLRATPYSLRGEGDVHRAATNNGPVTMDVSDTWPLRADQGGYF